MNEERVNIEQNQRDSGRGPFPPLLLLAVALVGWFAFQTLQLINERQQLEALRVSQGPQVEAAGKVRASLDTVAVATARLADAGIAADPERLAQELVLYASKIDVEEELSRLSAHVDELRRTLARGGAMGKRLDFLMQEFNRESNTLGSKSVDTSTTQAAIELKVLIEQMREQIQNVE
jgi:uncharacterized protein (TIGR00255 family)